MAFNTMWPLIQIWFSLLYFSSSCYASLYPNCPKYFKMVKGKCYYSIRYLEEQPQSGLQKFPAQNNDGLSPKIIELGKSLFFDPVLSGNKKISCAHCHHPHHGLSDGRKLSVGGDGRSLKRSSPSLWNTAFSSPLFWDGRAKTLESQITGPLFSKAEMHSSEKQMIERLNRIPRYQILFKDAFQQNEITFKMVVEAIVAFEKTLISFNSRYDHYVFGDKTSLTADEEKGFQLFRSFVTRCTECHTPPLFTNMQLAVVGAPDTGNEKDQGAKNKAFRVPTLRNSAQTAPYMHSGAFDTLLQVVQFYNLGAGRGPLGTPSQFLHWHLREMGLTKEEESQLVSFLGALTDESALPEIPDSVPSGLPVAKELN